MGADDDLLALETARNDQAAAAGVDLARMLVGFNRECRTQMDDQLSADLTVMYFEALLGATVTAGDDD